MRTVRWGILGPGGIARAFAAGLRASEGAALVAVASRDRARAEAFAAAHGAARAHGSYEALAHDPDVDAVYVATPHAFHHDHALLCLHAGKHVLCEKPLALNARQGARMAAAARAAGRVLMEGMWTRFLPAVVRLHELVRDGAVGEVRSVTADLGFRAAFDPASRLFAPALGGGALLDLGVYPLHLTRMLCGEPQAVRTLAHVGATGVDEACVLLLRHEGGVLATLSASLRAATPCDAHVTGSEGRLTLPAPWWAASRVVRRDAEGRETAEDHPVRGGGFAHEAEAFMAAIRAGAAGCAALPPDESVGVLRTMDAARAEWGVAYPGERAP